MRQMKALILDDDMYKTIAIQRALNYCGIQDVKTVSNQKKGVNYIYQCLEDNEPLGIIVTDMQYPLAYGEEVNTEAGFKLVDRLEKEGIAIPIIICSRINIKEPRVLGTVWYNEMRDIKSDFKEILADLLKEYV